MQASSTQLREVGLAKAGGRRVLVLLTWSAALLFLCSPVLAQEAAAEGPAVAAQSPVGGVLEVLFFYGFALATVVSALAICISRNIVRMAVWLFATLGSVAVLYFLLAAYFIAAIQLIVYAGGTLVLLVFGVMLTSKTPWARFDTKRWEMIAASVVCLVLVAAMIGALFATDWPQDQPADPQPVAVLGRELLTTYLVPFEVASVLLLAVMIGAAHLARQEK
jgi:NADH:ubiquinone oxidoreductase subunit 6 (subunit J)